MKSFLSQTVGMFLKDIRLWARDRQAAVGPMLLPLVLLFICTVLFGYGGDEWNIGLIVEGQGEHALAFAEQVETLESNISPYFRIVTRDAQEAQKLYEAGRLQLVITIPADFDTQIAAGKAPVIRTQVYNINTDMTKNVRLRLERAIQAYLESQGKTPLTVAQFTTRPDDVWRRAFIAGGALVVALLAGASLNTAIAMAREWERNTSKEVRLAPNAFLPLVVGKILAGLTATAANMTVTLALAVALFGLRIPPDRWLSLAAIGFGVALAASGIGLGVGAWFRDYRTIQPLLIVTVAGSFFAAGGYASVPTLPPFVQAFDVYWPIAYVFETLQGIMHGAEVPSLFLPLIWSYIAAIFGLGFGILSVRKVI